MHNPEMEFELEHLKRELRGLKVAMAAVIGVVACSLLSGQGPFQYEEIRTTRIILYDENREPKGFLGVKDGTAALLLGAANRPHAGLLVDHQSAELTVGGGHNQTVHVAAKDHGEGAPVAMVLARGRSGEASIGVHGSGAGMGPALWALPTNGEMWVAP